MYLHLGNQVIALQKSVLGVFDMDTATWSHRTRETLEKWEQAGQVENAAGDLIAPAAELAARVQHREHDLKRGLARLRLHVHGAAAAIVAHADDVAGLDGQLNMAAVARERLVNGVVDDLIHEVVQTGRRRRADVHTRTLAHGLQTLEHLDLAGVIFLCDLVCDIWHGFASFRTAPRSEILQSAGLAAFI